MSQQTLFRGRVFLRICGKECRDRMLESVEAKTPSVTLIHYLGLNSSRLEVFDDHGWPRVASSLAGDCWQKTQSPA